MVALAKTRKILRAMVLLKSEVSMVKPPAPDSARQLYSLRQLRTLWGMAEEMIPLMVATSWVA